MIRDTVSAMNKEILAISISAVLVLAFVLPAINANALTSAENKALKTILDLTTSVKDKLANNIQPTLTTIKQDLQFKKKFWQYEPCKDEAVSTKDGSNCWFAFSSTEIQVEQFFNGPSSGCILPADDCAFTVESIQLAGNVACIDHLEIDGADVGVPPNTCTPTNLLVDTNIGSIGASHEVSIHFKSPYTGPVEFNGEKPQGYSLCTEDHIIVINEQKFAIGGPNPCGEGS